ncbi:uncharacterized protein LOC135813525 [Sycon ciliatum]|uniref:uncharacterized protein LOC135813525 n=1 Tax=Sycon ciliatum TaxID=27933 RepID=UPI0031F60C6B
MLAMSRATQFLVSALFCVLPWWLPGSSGLWLPLTKVKDSIVESTGARCLDGSNPAYYLSMPSDPKAVSNWRIHFRGGGWCFTAEECHGRSKTSMGSSLLLPQTIEDAHDGFMTTNTTVNPKFGNWGVVYIEYCDGSSYLSDVEQPMKLFGDTIYFRGRRILAAVFQDLEERVKLLSLGKKVVLSGTSAGGLATYLHCNTVQKMLNADCDFRCLPDAGLFLDHADMHGQATYETEVKAGLDLWNGTHNLDKTCMDAFKSAGTPWKCAFSQYIIPFITPPLFILNSMYDKASMGLVLHLNCNPSHAGSCSTEQLKAFQAYHLAMASALQPALTAGNSTGVFATACYQHEESCQNPDWLGITIKSVSMRRAVEQWYDGGNVKLVDTTWPNDHSCVLNITHGPC